MNMNPSSNEVIRRVNGALLGQQRGKPVCLMGSVVEPDSSGMSFKLKTSDNLTVIIQLQEPLQDYVQGIVEVQGVAKSDKLVSCNNYIQFPTEYTKDFDMEAYNETVFLMNREPSPYYTTAV